MKPVKLSIVFIIIFVFYGQNDLMAQSYLHSRIGLGWGRYAPYDKDKLDVNEHNIKLGIIIDTEYGRKFAIKGVDEKFALFLGGRLGYNLRIIEGTFTETTWDPDADIDAHMFSAFLTTGASMRISDRFSIFFQANIGPTFILWYQDQTYRDSFWVFYLPIDLGGEYKLKDDLNLTFGINVQMPIYTGTAETVMLGIRKSF